MSAIVIGESTFKKRLRQRNPCRHKQLIYDKELQTVHCEDCKEQISPFKALMLVVSGFEETESRLNYRESKVAEAESKTIRLKAAQSIERKWRSRSKVPACPHCHEGLFPEDILHAGSVNKEMAKEARRFKNK